MSSTPSPPGKIDRRRAAREHAAELRAAERQRQRRRKTVIWFSTGGGVVLAAVAVIALVLSLASPGGSAAPTTAGTLAGALGPEGIAVESGTPLAADTTSSSGATKDGIACNAGEGSVEHLHTHLSVYVDGVLRPIPVGIGAVTPSIDNAGTADAFAQATKCFYWLHVHASDGIIHVEAPTKDSYTLGQFFAVWGQPLSSTTVAGATGTQTVTVNGKVVTGDPAAITLGSREDIQIDVGKAVPYQKVDWSKSEL